MKIKKGDKVKILAGKDRDKTGKVLQIFSSRGRASVEGLNLLVKHMRPRKQGEKGQRIEFPAPVNISNLMLVCPKCGKPSRVGYKYVAASKRAGAAGSSAGGQGAEKTARATERKKVRICMKCRATVD